MPKKRFNLPKGLQNKPAGSENWYQLFYKKTQRPTIKWVRLDAHDLTGAKIERERLLRAYELGLMDPWAAKEDAEPRKDLTLRQAIDAFLDAHATLAPSTLKTKRFALSTFSKHVPASRRRRLEQITVADVERFTERPGLKESTRRRRLTELATFFSWAADEGLVEDNPALAYKRRRRRGLSHYARRQAATHTRAALMPSDIRRLLAEIQAKAQHVFLVDVFAFLASTGLRRSELCYLRRQDVILADPPSGCDLPVTGLLRIRCWDDPRTGAAFRTKNGRDRTVPMAPLACQIAARQMAGAADEDDFAPLFRAQRGGRIRPDDLSRTFKQYRERVGLPENVTLHSLRHSFASWCMMLGLNVFALKSLLGHSSFSELDRYAQVAEEFLLGDARRLQREMLRLLCPGLPSRAIDHALPSRRMFAAEQLTGTRATSVALRLPMVEVLFSGVLYEAAVEPARAADDLGVGFLETF